MDGRGCGDDWKGWKVDVVVVRGGRKWMWSWLETVERGLKKNYNNHDVFYHFVHPPPFSTHSPDGAKKHVSTHVSRLGRYISSGRRTDDLTDGRTKPFKQSLVRDFEIWSSYSHRLPAKTKKCYTLGNEDNRRVNRLNSDSQIDLASVNCHMKKTAAAHQ